MVVYLYAGFLHCRHRVQTADQHHAYAVEVDIDLANRLADIAGGKHAVDAGLGQARDNVVRYRTADGRYLAEISQDVPRFRCAQPGTPRSSWL